MKKYIIRLDDACPQMNKEGWGKIEKILDKYNITPLVGVIPDNQDDKFTWESDPEFWDVTVPRWINKGWSIAQHGLHHVLFKDEDSSLWTEFYGLTYEKQKEMLGEGYDNLISHNVKPSSFFAPCHTFDDNTIRACVDLGYYDYISDGYAFFPYEEQKMQFIPQLFDTPHSVLPFGTYTFVFHPNFTTDDQFAQLEAFLKANKQYFVNSDSVFGVNQKVHKRTFVERAIEPTMNFLRKLRNR